MRSAVHTATAKVRIHPDLLASIEAKAHREGMSVSELMRHALRREVREAA